MRKRILQSLPVLAILAVSLFITGCSSVKSTSIVNRDYDTRFPNSIIISPMVEPQVEVEPEMVQGEASFSTLFGIFRIGESPGDAYDYAVNQALDSANAHFLIAPRAEYVTTNYLIYKKGVLRIKGFPGKYKSFKQIRGKEYLDHLDKLKDDKEQFKKKEKGFLSGIFE